MVAPQDFIYTRNELISHIGFPNFVRLLNFQFSSNNALESRLGFEPVHYLINPTVEDPNTEPCHIEFDEVKGLLKMPEVKYTDGKTYFLNHIEVAKLTLFGDSLIFSGPNASSFHIVPFTLNPQGFSNVYSYIAKDELGVSVEGDEKGGIHLYFGKPIFWNGKGTYQKFANTINESGFTNLDNSIFPLEDQTVIAACTVEERLVVATLQGYIMWSPPQWDGESVWDDIGSPGENWIRVTLEPGEIIEFISPAKSGLLISTRDSAKVSGKLYNITTLVLAEARKIQTGQNSFYSRNGVVTLDDALYGISPLGFLKVEYDPYSQLMKGKNKSSQLSILFEEIFANNTVFSFLSSFFDTKYKNAYFIYEWDLSGKFTTKIMNYHFDVEKWSILETQLPIQKMFMYYGFAAGAGWIHDSEGNIYLGIWSLSELRQDIPIKVKGAKTVNNIEYTYFELDKPAPYRKYFVTGAINMSEIGNFVPGTGSLPIQTFFSADEKIEYKLGSRHFSQYGDWSPGVYDFDDNPVLETTDVEIWSQPNQANGIWGTTHKIHYLHRKALCMFPNIDLAYQMFFESYSDALITIHDMSPDKASNT
jgi:hypothetical protein